MTRDTRDDALTVFGALVAARAENYLAAICGQEPPNPNVFVDPDDARAYLNTDPTDGRHP